MLRSVWGRAAAKKALLAVYAVLMDAAKTVGFGPGGMEVGRTAKARRKVTNSRRFS